ncbi:head GIN domain-containing protein [Abyssalbus ytuae]|uniref:DUF2807 domain-containing protein n=1 Tax=Abyssalbus ytuae TaxID=2926907 RepID=A0A9E6ZQ27_9FLAO|nr:head GIN domain-containing protein [Abyssalbus ytuae]UOB18844.1 DUF2807 domain-containing protein [Abyssalbus ytuae]
MRRFVYIIGLVLFACNNESANDCFQTRGDSVQKEFEVSSFNKILVNEGVEMTLTEGDEYKVVVKTGKNLLDDVKVEVVDGQLILSDNNSCNYFRSYDPTKILVTSPDITEIRSSTQFDIKSEGVLTYPDLVIYSENYREEYQTVGDFYLQINNQSFRLVFNNLSNCYISGTTNLLSINFASGNGRFEGEDLICNNVSIYHRGSNDIIVHAVSTLAGNLYGTGNLISVNHPDEVNVTEYYKGKLIFRD